MKRNTSLSTSLKGYSTYSAPVTNNCHRNKNQMTKEIWDCNSNSQSEEHYMNGFPWPPRSYTCSFCRKEFKSAQALGGHMNVHRRDRARLRQSSPTPDQVAHHPIPMLNLNLNPSTTNNNPNCSTSSHLSSNNSSSATTLIKPPTCTLPLFVSPNNSSSSASPWFVVDGILLNPLRTKTSEPIITRSSSLSGVGEYDHAFAPCEEDGCRMLKKKGGDQILRMDLEIGLPARDHYDLDLELRLGTNYS